MMGGKDRENCSSPKEGSTAVSAMDAWQNEEQDYEQKRRLVRRWRPMIKIIFICHGSSR